MNYNVVHESTKPSARPQKSRRTAFYPVDCVLGTGVSCSLFQRRSLPPGLIVCITLTPFAFLLGRNFAEIVVLLGVLVSVLTVELINSAIEVLADTVSAETHPLIGQTKDIASAAVMMVITFAGLVWFGLLLVRLFSH